MAPPLFLHLHLSIDFFIFPVIPPVTPPPRFPPLLPPSSVFMPLKRLLEIPGISFLSGVSGVRRPRYGRLRVMLYFRNALDKRQAEVQRHLSCGMILFLSTSVTGWCETD